MTSGCEPDGHLRMGPWPARPGQTHMSIWCEGERHAVSDVALNGPDGTTQRRSFERLDHRTFLATFEDLVPDTTYDFVLEDGEGITRTGSFRTLPTATGKLELAFGADIHPASMPYTTFGAVLSHLPHLFVGLGDQVYADLDPSKPLVTTDEAFDALYARTWNDPDLIACWSNVATLLVWDDHETRNDFTPVGDPADDAAARAYERYQWARSGASEAYLELDLGPASMFLLDTRTFRSPNEAPDGPGKTMLGEAQRAALLDYIANATSEVCIIASPTPFHVYADTGKDAWAHGFAFERGIILQAIADRGAERFVLVTGDQHWPAVVRHALPGAQTLLELQCTPVAAFARTPTTSTSPDLLFVGDGSPGFGSLVVDGGTTPSTVDFAWINAQGEAEYTLRVRG